MSRRESIYLTGFAHKNPVPAACRIGGYLASGVLTGRDPESHEMPSGLDAQVTNIFAHVRELMHAAGGSTRPAAGHPPGVGHDRVRGTAGIRSGAHVGLGVDEPARPQLRRVPRHVGMVPAQPRQHRPVRRQRRGRGPVPVRDERHRLDRLGRP